jgi:microcystin-dependent protein
MADAFTAEIRIVPYTFAPTGWAFCDGQLLAITQNAGLYSLIGNFYGGDGQTTFALPDLRGSLPVGVGQGATLSNYDIGQTGGAAAVALTEQQIPVHTHTVAASTAAGDTNSPVAATWASPRYGRVTEKAYASGTGDTQLSAAAFASVGLGHAHNNLPPYLALNFIICLGGTFPPRT